MKIFLTALVLGVSLMAMADDMMEQEPSAAIAKKTNKEKAKNEKKAAKKAAKKENKKWSAEQIALRDRMVALFESSKKVNHPKLKKKARNDINKSVDWDTITKTCLGKENWKKNPKGRVKFKALLQDIIALSAYSRMGDFWDGSSYEFTKIEVKGNKGRISADFTTKDDDEYELEYFMIKKGKKWYMYDLSYEDLRYSENINEQVVAFLKEKPFSKLLSRMTKKKKDLIEDEKKPKGTSRKSGSSNSL